MPNQPEQNPQVHQRCECHDCTQARARERNPFVSVLPATRPPYWGLRDYGVPGQMGLEKTFLRNKRSVWNVATAPFTEAHFATFPPDLIKPCILAGSRSDDIVLDAFMGTGTTALVAAELSRNYLGIELNPAYVEIANKRLANETAQMKIAI